MLAAGERLDQRFIVIVRRRQADDGIRQPGTVHDFEMRIGEDPLPQPIERTRGAAADEDAKGHYPLVV
jgi:hypothetical protein